MNDNHKNTSGFKTIKPIPVSANTNPDKHNSDKSFNTKNFGIGLALGLLGIGVIIVIFFLPNWVNTSAPESSIANTSTTTTNSTPSVTQQPRTTEISPWEKTQESKIRKEAQFVLQEILNAQKTLEENNINQWKKDDYNNALAIAKQGDVFYNKKEFVQAKEQYETALAQLNNLIEQIDVTYKISLQQGQAALVSGDQAVAIKAFETALLFKEQTGEASSGLASAQILDQVFAHIDAGNNALDNNKLIQAKQEFEAALKLDPETRIAKEKIASINQSLNNIQFRKHMTAGFNALEQQQFDAAKSQFNRALALKPNSAEANSALQQANTQSSNNSISTALNMARGAEQEENWQEAINYYQEALAIDKNLSIAISGTKKAQTQLATYEKLSTILQQTDRLSDKAVFAEVQNFHNSLRQIKTPGPKLAAKIEQLGRQLSISAAPVNIRLLSDNQTQVTVYKVGDMGVFESKQINLRPGRYTAIGIRPGYRDVRVEFLVSADKDNIVNIKTIEKIN